MLSFNLLPAEVADDEPSFTLDLTRTADLSEQISAVLPLLAGFDDEQLVEIATNARRLEACAFRLRGACVAELRRRITLRLTGGRGKRDTAGAGISAQLTQLATRIGVSAATLKTDARIHATFFADEPETRLARDTTLPREFYVIALGAPDPLHALYAAHARSADSPYSRDQFRRDVLALKHPAKPAAAPPAAIDEPTSNGAGPRILIKPEARHALQQLTKLHGQSPADVVAQALLAYYEARAAAAATPPASTKPRANKSDVSDLPPQRAQLSLLS